MTNRSRTLIVLIAVFLAGCLLGIAGHQVYISRTLKPPANPAILRFRGSGDRLAQLLQLTPEQQPKLNAILEDSRRQIDSISAESGTKLEAIRSATNGKIAAILNEDQKKRFQQLLNERGHHKHFGSGPGGHRGERGPGMRQEEPLGNAR